MPEFYYPYDENKTAQAIAAFKEIRVVLDSLNIPYTMDIERLTVLFQIEEPDELIEMKIAVNLAYERLSWSAYFVFLSSESVDNNLALLHALNKINLRLAVGAFAAGDDPGHVALSYVWYYGLQAAETETLYRITTLLIRTIRRFTPQLKQIVSGERTGDELQF